MRILKRNLSMVLQSHTAHIQCTLDGESHHGQSLLIFFTENRSVKRRNRRHEPFQTIFHLNNTFCRRNRRSSVKVRVSSHYLIRYSNVR